MQARLLEATVEVLVEKGYRGTTTLEVQKRADVSRGALLHHFTSRSELLLAAVEHLLRARIGTLTELAAQQPPRTPRIDWAVTVLWGTFEGPLFTAALELWLAARHDEDLLAVLVPHERTLGTAIRGLAATLFGEDAEHPAFDDALELLLDAMRGAAARKPLRASRTDDRLVKAWCRLMHERLGR